METFVNDTGSDGGGTLFGTGEQYVANETYLPCQQPSRKNHDNPELKLVEAVLQDALYIVTHRRVPSLNSSSQSPARREQIIAQDVAWIADDADYPFSFTWCCDHLGLNPVAIREQLASGKPTFIERRTTAVKSECVIIPERERDKKRKHVRTRPLPQGTV